MGFFCICFCVLCVAFPLASNSFEMPYEPIMVIETNQGEIHLKLYSETAPKAVENFVRLAESGYYDNTKFHRIINEFMIQGGDPTGTGSGGQSIWGKSFEDEFSEGVGFDRPGLLGMANAGPKTNGSQFFITTVPTPWLNGRHTVFGEVVRGMETVRKLDQAGTSSGKPKGDQVILKVYRAAKD